MDEYRMPMFQVVDTERVTSHGREYSVETNFAFKMDILKYFNKRWVSIFHIDGENPKKFYVYIKDVGINGKEFLGKIVQCCNDYVADHIFELDRTVGLFAKKMDSETVKDRISNGIDSMAREHIRNLKAELDRAVDCEDYMEAARLRDQIKGLNVQKAEK